MAKVAKFGGTSLANAERIRRVKAIIDADRERRFIVPSAPGKEHPEDAKITDLLYLVHELIVAHQDPEAVWSRIEERFTSIVAELAAPVDIGAVLAETHERLVSGASQEYAASRGEAINGRIVAAFLGAEFVDAADVVRFDDYGRFDRASYRLIAERCAGPGRYVIPGFYGAKADGSIHTFSRGGSDVSGAVVANAVDATVYENWTDTSGFRMADPRIVPAAKRIEIMTYRELRELSYMGASVLHEEAIFPVREKGIPVNIRNTFDPDCVGTMIVASRDPHGQIVTGIAGKRGFSVFSVEKAMMNEEIGFGRRVLEVFERYDVSYEHMPSGIDTLSVVVSRNQVKEVEPLIVADLEMLRTDRVEVLHGIGLIATVGLGMNHSIGTAARLFAALSRHRINIRMIDQGSSEQNIIVGVNEADFDAAIAAIHQEFVVEEG
jgi:aspartate kinase